MIRQNLHTHTNYGDGHDNPERMVLVAIEKGFASLGFSEHAYAPYDGDCCIKQDEIPAYCEEIGRLKRKYAGTLEIFLGFECDSHYCAYTDRSGLDYVIGSVHYIHNPEAGEYYPIDYKPELFEKALNEAAGGDIERLVGMYYADIARLALEYRPDILGHVDLIMRLNQDNRYFDPQSVWYRRMIGETAEKIAASGCIVEINTGGMYRGALKQPYPDGEFLRLLLERGVPVTVSSDAHCAEALDHWFSQAERMLRDAGCRSVRQLTANGFIDLKI